MSTASAYLDEVRGLGFRVLGKTGSGHLAVEHPTRGVRAHIPSTPDGTTTVRKTVASLRRKLDQGAKASDVFLDWLCHEYEVGPTETKRVEINLLNEARRWAATPEAPRRPGGLPPNVDSILTMARGSDRMRCVRRATGRAPGLLSTWEVSGARVGFDVVVPAENGSGIRPWPPSRRPTPELPELPPVAPVGTVPETLWAQTVEAPEPVPEAPATPPDANGHSLVAGPSSLTPEELARIIPALRRVLWPDIAARDELAREGLRIALEALETSAQHVRSVLALWDTDATPPTKEAP